jgi:hypothetical protein
VGAEVGAVAAQVFDEAFVVAAERVFIPGVVPDPDPGERVRVAAHHPDHVVALEVGGAFECPRRRFAAFEPERWRVAADGAETPRV